MVEQNCAHEDCECIVRDADGVAKGDDTYCSKYCASAGPTRGQLGRMSVRSSRVRLTLTVPSAGMA